LYQPEQSLDPSNSSISETPESLSDYLKSLDPEPLNESTAIETDILQYERKPRLALNANVLEFWCTQYNVLSSVAVIVLDILSTQVSVERLFSALKYISDISPHNLEHILLVRVNKNLSIKTDVFVSIYHQRARSSSFSLY